MKIIETLDGRWPGTVMWWKQNLPNYYSFRIAFPMIDFWTTTPLPAWEETSESETREGEIDQNPVFQYCAQISYIDLRKMLTK